MQQRTPLSDGTLVASAANYSTFKLLLTGVDDSALVAADKKEPDELPREAQIN